METAGPALMTYRMSYELALLARRLLVRDGFLVYDGPSYLPASRFFELRIAVESEGRRVRAAEIMQRWVPEATLLADTRERPAA